MDTFFKYINYAEKIQQKELTLIPIDDTRKVEEYLNSIQKNSKGNRLKIQHLRDAIEIISQQESANESNLKCVVSAANTYVDSNYIWAHLAFISKSSIKEKCQWHLYGYIRGHFRHEHITGKIGVTAYRSESPGKNILSKEMQQKTVHEKLKSLISTQQNKHSGHP